jgi:hypothetical protein
MESAGFFPIARLEGLYGFLRALLLDIANSCALPLVYAASCL